MNKTVEKPRILVVDDEPSNLNLLEMVLGAEFEVTAVSSGRTAIDKSITDPPPELVVLDLVMPGMDGFATLAALKDNVATKDIPVIMLSGRATEPNERRALELGASDYMAKPVRPSIFKSRIRTQLELRKKTRLLEELSRFDSLTGLFNQRAFQELYGRCWGQAARNDSWISVATIDIDLFKRYNDAFGHLAGDTCLAAVADAITGPLRRAGDIAVRFGGEEFLLILPDVEPSGALQVMERLRLAVIDLGIRVPSGGIAPQVTVSIGLASTRPAPQQEMAELVAAADQQLLEAKRAGRNQVKSTILEFAAETEL